MEANFDVFDFKLTNIDMDVMELLDQQDFLEDHHTALGLERLLQLKWEHKIKPLISSFRNRYKWFIDALYFIIVVSILYFI